MEILQPAQWKRPRGYSHGVVARGTWVFVAGMVGWDNACEEFDSLDFVDQARRALENIVTVLEEAGAQPEHLVRLTWYVTDRDEYLSSLERLGQVYREVIGRHYPAMSVVEVKGLVEPGAKVEIEATAVIPDGRGEPGRPAVFRENGHAHERGEDT